MTIKCPDCKSKDIIKKGFGKGKQRYQCKDCGRAFVYGGIIRPNMIKKKPKTPKVFNKDLLGDEWDGNGWY